MRDNMTQMNHRPGAMTRIIGGWLVAAICGALLIGFGTVAAPGQALTKQSVAPKRSSYCADQKVPFTDPHAFVGITDPYVEIGTPHYRDCSFGRMAADHIGFFRGALSWGAVEAVPHRYDFGVSDGIVSQLAKHHMRFLPVFLGVPPRDSTAPSKGALPGMYPPAHPNQFAYFVSLSVKRYGPGGTFWRANPKLPYYPVRAWQIWNEPNLAGYWEPRPNPRAYVRLLRAADVALKQVDPRAVVVTAGMPFTGVGPEVAFLSQLYRAGVHGTFDALSIHDYAVTPGGALERLQTARAVMNRFGDRRKGLWVTEWSWAGGPPNPYIVNHAGQRANIAAFLALVQHHRAELRLDELMYYGWRDMVSGPGPRSYWAYNLGLLSHGLLPKPALGVFSTAARRLDR